MNHEQLVEAVKNLLSIGDEPRQDQCDQCGDPSYGVWGEVGGQPVCRHCIRLHAHLVLNHAERAEAGDAQSYADLAASGGIVDAP